MRGDERFQDEMFSCLTLEQRVPQDHPLREICELTDVVLVSLNDEFDALYSASGRPSIAPEYVLRALLLQVFYSVRSERQLVEQLDYWTTTCSSAGSSGSSWMTRCGTMQCFRRTETAC